jgi:indoleamine 2,3-dioxygenase
MPTVETAKLARFEVSRANGFLPDEPPLRSFGPDAGPFLQRLDELASELPSLLESDQLRPRVDELSAPNAGWLDGRSPRERRRAYTVCGFLANGYVHQLGAPSVKSIPAGVAVPLYDAASALGRTPVLSYDAYALHNWRRLAPDGAMRPHHLDSNVNFVDLVDERWFIVIHVAIESAAGPALAAIGDAQQAIADDDAEGVRRALRTVEEAMHELIGLLDRMGEHNHPDQYGRGFRPYLGALTKVRFEGVDALDGPQSFRGASGAQSSVFPALDAGFGIDHGDNPLVAHLEALRADMPPAHQRFIEAAAESPDIRAYVQDADESVQAAFNECLDRMVRFRELHLDVVQTYLADELGETEGTGGTPYGRFLSMFVDSTRECKLAS